MPTPDDYNTLKWLHGIYITKSRYSPIAKGGDIIVGKHQDGGYHFPQDSGAPGHSMRQGGTTQRDEFAKAALIGILSGRMLQESKEPLTSEMLQYICTDAYNFADNMILQRER